MEKLKMHSMSKIDENVKKIAALFPECITEIVNDKGELEKVVDIDAFRQLFSKTAVEGNQERYQFTWPDKRKAKALVNQEVTSTLRPCREESVNFDTTENLYIEGDNLEVLKLLQETYLGKIKMIYIDPPYNTGHDFVYEDDFSQKADDYASNSGQYNEQGNRLVSNTESNGRFHTDWLNMMYPRLRLAKDLLSPDGVIAISIGYQEINNLVRMCQEIFDGRLIMPITVQTSGGKPNCGFNISHEYIVFAVPNDFEPIPTEEDMKEYSTPYHGMNLATFNQVQRPNQVYPIYIDSEGCIIGCGKTLQERLDDGSFTGRPNEYVYGDGDVMPKEAMTAVWPITNKNEQCVWRLIPSRLMKDWQQGYIKVIPSAKGTYSIQYLSEGIISKIKSGELATYKISTNPRIPTLDVKDYKTAGAGIPTVWTNTQYYTTRGSNQIKELFGQKCFSYPKPLELLLYIFKRTTSNQDIVLDFFSGSSTSAHAILKLNAEDGHKRKFIMVQLPEHCEDQSEAQKAGYENICEIGKERIRRAGKMILEEMKQKNRELFAEDSNLDIGFRNLKLDSSNMNDVYYTPDETDQGMLDGFISNIKEDRTAEDLLFQVMLDLGVLLSAKIVEEDIGGKKVFNVDDNYLIACFDENVDENVIMEAAKKKPTYFVMRDSSLANDSVSVNFDQIFARYSPDTVRKVL